MPLLVSLICLKLEIDLHAMDNDDNNVAGAVCPKNNTKDYQDQRKTHEIKIENYMNSENSAIERKGLLPSDVKESTPKSDDMLPDTLDDKAFFSGNPFIEVTKGIIHMYKKNELIEMKNGPSNIICLFAVPATLSCHDIINFVAPCHPVIQHIRIIRDSTPNQYMVLLEFRSTESAMEFYHTFNGTAYNSLEPDSVCHAVWVSNVEWGHDGSPPLGHTELPTCPVCLERMDESVDSVLTILCNHAFHANCLIKWGDSTCPVCRCVQTPELSESSVCMECESTEALWICLICGHVGCGRYLSGHAASHFRSTNHLYALQIGSNRVWDYAGDNFVHRLLQNKSDGKLVDTKNANGEDEEKMDSIQLDFMYTLTSQLDTQRKFYEDRLNALQTHIEKVEETNKTAFDEIKNKCIEFESKLQTIGKEKATLEKKYTNINSKNTTLAKDLAEEKQMSKALQSNYQIWKSKCDELETKCTKIEEEKNIEIAELKEQIRDLMFFLESQNVIANSELKDEIATATVIVPPAAPSASNDKTRRKKK